MLIDTSMMSVSLFLDAYSSRYNAASTPTGKASIRVIAMVISDPLNAAQIPTADGSVASAPVRNVQLKPVRKASLCASAATVFSAAGSPLRLNATSNRESAGNQSVCLDVTRSGLSIKHLPHIGCCGGCQQAVAQPAYCCPTASSTMPGMSIEFSAASAFGPVTDAAVVPAVSAGKSNSTAISVRWKPRRPWPSMVNNRKARNKRRQGDGHKAHRFKTPLSRIAAGNALLHDLPVPVGRALGR